jgi:hypothetical protein
LRLNGKPGGLTAMASAPKVYINGKLFDKADAKISVFDQILADRPADQVGAEEGIVGVRRCHRAPSFAH